MIWVSRSVAFVAFFCVFFLSGHAVAKVSDPFQARVLLEKKRSESAILEYKRRIHEIDMDRLRLKADHEWLLLKIMRIQYDGRAVPEELPAAKARIEKKIKSGSGEKKELVRLMEGHYKTVGELDGKVRQKYSKKPEWWLVDPATIRKAAPAPRSSEKGAAGKKAPTKRSVQKGSIQKKIKAVGLGDWVQLIEGKSGVRLENRLPILFASGKTDVSREYGSFFKKLARLIKQYPSWVKVEGFTDNTRIKSKKYDSNFELGARRASRVARELIRYGVKPATLRIESRGVYGRRLTGASKQSRAMSRRAEITVYFK